MINDDNKSLYVLYISCDIFYFCQIRSAILLKIVNEFCEIMRIYIWNYYIFLYI